MGKTVVLFKTHRWSEDIEKFTLKLYDETNGKVDFFILMHSDNGQLQNQIQNENLKNITLSFTEDDIKSIYQTGFYSMWISNHWILMWFYKKNGRYYDYFWSMEYDVRISGDSSRIWLHQSPCDFLYTLGNYRNANNRFMSYYIGGKLNNLEKIFGFLQVARYSNRALKYLDECYTDGENGQDELITFSLLNRAKFIGSRLFLQKLIRGKWTWEDKYADYNRRLYEEAERKNHDNHLYIYHPIK